MWQLHEVQWRIDEASKIITKPDKRFASVVWVLLDVLGFLSLGLAWSQSHWCWFVHLLYDELEPVFVFLGSHFWHLRDHGHYFIWCSWSCSSFLLSIGGLWGRLGGSILRMIKGMVERMIKGIELTSLHTTKYKGNSDKLTTEKTTGSLSSVMFNLLRFCVATIEQDEMVNEA